MKKQVFKKCVAAISACAIMASAMPMISIPASAGSNLITNSTFDKGVSDWGTYKESGGVCSLKAEDGKLALTVTKVGKVNYAVQVFYDIVPLYKACIV